MIHVTVCYPQAEGATFDHDYYRDKHLPMVRRLVGDAIVRAEIDRAVASADPTADPAWMATGHLYFASMESFQSSFGPHAEEIMADLPNFTNAQPDVVISEVIDA